MISQQNKFIFIIKLFISINKEMNYFKEIDIIDGDNEETCASAHLKRSEMDEIVRAKLCPYRNYDGYIFNLKLQMSINSKEGYTNRGRILKAIAALLAARLVHKYPMWKVTSNTIFTLLLDDLTLELPSFIADQLWKSHINIRAYNFKVPLDIGIPIIYDTFNYSGILTPITSGSDEYYSHPVDLSYSMEFYISPALEKALPFYKAEGFRTSADRSSLSASTLIYYFDFLNRIKYNCEYDHLREWRNIIELTDYRHELSDKVSVIEKLKELKQKCEKTIKAIETIEC